MVFNFGVDNILLPVLLVWLAVLSFFLWQTRTHYNKLVKGTTAKGLTEALERILEDSGVSQKRIDELTTRCQKIEKEGLLHAQKIGLVRFNPFKDTGGDQSFVLAILDGHDNGVVVSSLHGRTGTRWYAKTILEGKAREHNLSEEEERAIKQAQHRNGAGQAKLP